MKRQEIWQGRPDGPRFYQHVQLASLADEHLPAGALGLIGFACDAGISRNLGRPGASVGPDAIRKVLANLAMHRSPIQVFDFGDIDCPGADLERAQKNLAHAVTRLIKSKITPIVLGGGHEVAFGHYLGIATARPKLKLGILNFDAHFDMRPLIDGKLGSSGTPFLQIAEHARENKMPFRYTCLGVQRNGNTQSLFAQADRHDTHYVLAEFIHEQGLAACERAIDQLLSENDGIYMTLCLDVFAESFAPGVSSPQPLGLFPHHVAPLLRRVAQSGKLVGFDVAELSPPNDPNDATARLAAAMISQVVHALK